MLLNTPNLVSSSSEPAVTAAHLIVPSLYCPDPVRIDDRLGEAVDDLLLPWVSKMGIFPGQYQKIRASAFGRSAMLCHPYTDDVDRLLLAAQCMATLFSVDDHYCDDESYGAIPSLSAPRLSCSLAALEPAYLPIPYSLKLKEALKSDPVLVGLQDYITRVHYFSSHSQLARVRHETIAMFLTMAAEATWRINKTIPEIWEYLAFRQVNSFLPCIALIDIVGNYELPADIYFSQPVRRATVLGASATIIANDLYSAQKESVPDVKNFSLPQLLSSIHHCSIQEALGLGASVHDAIMHDYETAQQEALRNAPPVLKRYLDGLTAWISGSREWHRTSGRYQLSLS